MKIVNKTGGVCDEAITRRLTVLKHARGHLFCIGHADRMVWFGMGVIAFPQTLWLSFVDVVPNRSTCTSIHTSNRVHCTALTPCGTPMCMT